MRRGYDRVFLLCVLVTAACQSPAPEVEPQDPAVVQQEIAAWWTSWERALLDENVEGMRQLVTSDVKVMEPGMDLSGEGLFDVVEEILGAVDVAELSLQSRDVFVHGDVAYQVGQYDEVVVSAEGEFTVANFFFARWERGVDGGWRLDRIVAGPRGASEGM